LALRSEEIERVLKRLETVPGLEGAALVSSDGFMLASALPPEVSEDRVAAMGAAIVSIGERVNKELERGAFDMALISGSNGYTLATGAGIEAFLIVLASKNAKLGWVFLEVRRAAEELARILGR